MGVFGNILQDPWVHVVNFWQSIATSAFVQEHPKLSPNLFASTIPIGMHADAGAFSKQDSVYVFNWNSLVGRGHKEATNPTHITEYVWMFLIYDRAHGEG